jgi:phosphoribosylformylglycinamidine synthase II
MPGDLIVAVGGRTGRDGIHGATFSSLELTDQSETLSGGAVQIGNAIEEKKVLDALLKARDRGLYTALTDCGAGGFSSAVGEMGADLGADVHLEKAPLKYAGLSYSEVWISEAQERMVLSVPPAKWPELHDLCHAEGVEAVTLGTFEATGRLKLSYQETVVGDLPMHFLHDGRPDSARAATFTAKPPAPVTGDSAMTPQDALVAVLGSWTVCSKEGVVRQYDHEVQGGSVVKPLVGVLNDGPSDAAVITPVLGLTLGAAIGHGLCPQYADLDPHAAALCAVDEALRNVVAVGAAPAFAAILDNFCWGNVADPELLGALVRTAEACRDAALAYRTPFVSGKDSLNNEYKSPTQRITIPPTLLVTALARVPDITRCVTMDLKQAGNRLLLVGETHDHLGGSHYHLVTGRNGGRVPCPDLSTAPKLLAAVHAAISAGLVRSCHDLSEGGLVVAAAEMAFAGGVGADLTGLKSAPGMAGLPDPTRLFSETPTRFLVEVTPDHLTAFNATLVGHPVAEVGVTVSEQRLRIAGDGGEWLVWAKLGDLKEAWQKPLRD